MAKVQFGLSEIHLFPLTESTDSSTGVVTATYGTAVAFPGAVNLSLSVESEDPDPFYADDGIYYQPAAVSKGYTGTLEVALLPASIKTAFLNFIEDEDETIIELGSGEKKFFGMTCEKQTDTGTIKKVFYKCSFGIPEFSAATIEDSKSPATESVPITIIPTAKKYTYSPSTGVSVSTTVVSGTADETSDATVYANWHTSIHEPSFG